MAFATLPHLHVTWTQVVPAGGDTFAHYNLYRRVTGTTAWTRIATVTPITTVAYDDYTVASARSYDYAISCTVVRSSVPIESTLSGTLTASCTFTSLFLADVASPTNYIEYLGNARSVDDFQDQAMLTGWNSQTPTMYVGEAQSRHWQITSVPFLLSDQASMWTVLDALVTRQRTLGATFCYRDGSTGDAAFVAISTEQRSARSTGGSGGTTMVVRTDTVTTYNAKVDVIEVTYSEAV